MKIELGKDDQYQTRDGRPVRIHAVDIAGVYPVLLSRQLENSWVVDYATADGRFYANSSVDHSRDIIPAPAVRELWVNVYDGGVQIAISPNCPPPDVSTFVGRLHVKFRDRDIKDGVIELRSWKDGV